MKYLCLIYDDENRWLDATPDQQHATFAEHAALMEDAQKKGAWVHGEGLQPVRAATTLRIRDGKTIQTDGPFVELKEQIGGFYLFDCENLDQALALAAKIPEARTGAVEIRPAMVYEG
jgi:hypothetical protein